MDMLTIPAPTQTDIMTTARRVMPGDILLDRRGVPIALVTRARTRLTGRRVTRIEGEWLLSRPLGSSNVFRRTTMATTATAIRREI